MRPIDFSRIRPAVLVLLVGLVSACAGMSLGSNVIQEKTATTLNLNQNEFTISDRVTEGEKTSYTVATQRGKRYRCHVTGAASLKSSAVSNAICAELSAAAKPAAR